MKIRVTELRLDILPQTMAKDLENIVDLDHELHNPSGVERKRKELENNQNSGIVISLYILTIYRIRSTCERADKLKCPN